MSALDATEGEVTVDYGTFGSVDQACIEVIAAGVDEFFLVQFWPLTDAEVTPSAAGEPGRG